MTPAQELLSTLIKSAEGTRKEGFTTGGVTYTVNPAADTISGTFVIPVTPSVDATTGAVSYGATDFLNFLA